MNSLFGQAERTVLVPVGIDSSGIDSLRVNTVIRTRQLAPTLKAGHGAMGREPEAGSKAAGPGRPVNRRGRRRP
ncbi:MAG TPA: hypothetical protein PLH94_06525 [Fimbriimonadaceae bacterium]|nr:hypothetical protein [Fimbriimonadaceae bacterium]